MKRFTLIFSLLTFSWTVASAQGLGSDYGTPLHKTQLSRRTLEFLERKAVPVLGELLYFSRDWYSDAYAGMDGAMAREIDLLINGQPQAVSEATYDRSIDSTALSTRARNNLKSIGIVNVGQLLLAYRSSGKGAFARYFLRIPNAGKLSTAEISEYVQKLLGPKDRTLRTPIFDFVDQGFPRTVAIALEEREGITTVEELKHEYKTLGSDFARWLGRLPNVGRTAPAQVEQWLVKQMREDDCGQLLLDL